MDQLAARAGQLSQPGIREADHQAAFNRQLAEHDSGNPLFQRPACAPVTADAVASLRDCIRRARRMACA